MAFVMVLGWSRCVFLRFYLNARTENFIRGNFFAARQWSSLEDLNAQADAGCVGSSSDRRWSEDNTMMIGEAFAQEQSALLSLPETPYLTQERVQVRVGKAHYIRFDLNDHSLPPASVRSTVTVMASEQSVRIADDGRFLKFYSPS